MKKRKIATILTMILTMFMPMTVSATGTVSGNTPKTTVETPADQSPLDRMPYGVNIETLWIAEAGKYDIAETRLEKYDFAELVPGKTYEVAIHMTNNSDRDIATPWGIDYEILVPRIVEAKSSPCIEVTAYSDERNTDELWRHSWTPSAKIQAKEDVALIYQDQSNYVYRLKNGKPDAKFADKASFSWRPDSRILEKDGILLNATDQALWAGASKIVVFQFKTVALSEWEEFSAAMRKDPVEVKIDDVYQSLVDGKVHITSTLSLPEWLRNQMKGKDGFWRIMARPEIEERGRVSVAVRIENHSAAYASVVSNEVTLRSGSATLSTFTDASFNSYHDFAKSYESYEETWVECGTSDYDFRKDESIKIDMTVSVYGN